MTHSLTKVLLVFSLVLSAAATVCAQHTAASSAYSQAARLEAESLSAVGARSLEDASHASGQTMDGRWVFVPNSADGSAGVVNASYTPGHHGNGLTKNTGDLEFDSRNVPTPEGEEKESGPPAWTIYGGAAALGALQGGLAHGLVGALAGGALGLAAAYFYQKGDYGAAFGIMGGTIIGTALGGPIGGLIGAVVGGLLGHFIGKWFSKKKKGKGEGS